MGIDINAFRLLIRAKKMSVNFGEVLTIGRQVIQLSNEEAFDFF